MIKKPNDIVSSTQFKKGQMATLEETREKSAHLGHLNCKRKGHAKTNFEKTFFHELQTNIEDNQ